MVTHKSLFCLVAAFFLPALIFQPPGTALTLRQVTVARTVPMSGRFSLDFHGARCEVRCAGTPGMLLICIQRKGKEKRWQPFRSGHRGHTFGRSRGGSCPCAYLINLSFVIVEWPGRRHWCFFFRCIVVSLLFGQPATITS